MADKPTMTKEGLMKEIQICSLTTLETALYLDTHKTDKEALAYFNKHNKMLDDLKNEYVQKYGPLSIGDSTSETTWKWTDAPWPWEL